MSNNSKFLISFIGLSFYSCAPMLPMVKNETIQMPENFPNIINEINPNSGIAAQDPWNSFYKDEVLTGFINIAINNNQEIHIFEQEINIANNEIMAKQGEYLPKLGIEGESGKEKIERFSSQDANSPTRFTHFGAKASWEIDIWKRLRNAAKSSYMKYLSSIEGKRFLITNLVAEISNTYFDILALESQINIIKGYIDVLTRIKEIAEFQLNAARSTSLPVRRFEAEVAKNQARKSQLELKLIITQNKMNSILGRFPQALNLNTISFVEYKLLDIKSSVPSQLLDNRPDIKRAKFDLEASQLNVDVAKKRFYPALRIDGDLGYEGFNSKHFNGTTTSLFYGLTAGLTAPLLNRKAIQADYFSANNKQIQSLYNYELTLIKAYSEVSNQLNSIKNLNLVLNAKELQVKSLQNAFEISNMLFKAVRVDYIEVLYTQRDFLESQMELIEVKKQQLCATVDLYKALGGGWKGIESNDRESNY